MPEVFPDQLTASSCCRPDPFDAIEDLTGPVFRIYQTGLVMIYPVKVAHLCQIDHLYDGLQGKVHHENHILRLDVFIGKRLSIVNTSHLDVSLLHLLPLLQPVPDQGSRKVAIQVSTMIENKKLHKLQLLTKPQPQLG
jgi:hypothetical protein